MVYWCQSSSHEDALNAEDGILKFSFNITDIFHLQLVQVDLSLRCFRVGITC